MADRQTAAYRRVSTGDQGESGLGMDAQASKIEAMSLLHEREPDVEFTDTASAKSLDRPGISALLDGVRDGTIGTVYIAKLDRLTRSVRDLDTLLSLFQQHDVRLVSASESIDTATAAGRMVLNILGTVAQWEREAISERTTAALAELRKRGKRTGNVRYGYRDDGNGNEVPAPDERDNMALARGMRENGHSLGTIAAELNQAGRHTRTGKPWTRQGVAQSLLRGEGRPRR